MCWKVVYCRVGFHCGFYCHPMNFVETVTHTPFILAEGAVIERLRRDPNADLDPDVLHAGWIYDDVKRGKLEAIYRTYLDIGRNYNVPMIVFTPTWRANLERLQAVGFTNGSTVNQDCVRFMSEIRDDFGTYREKIFIGGLMGPRGDAYDPADAMKTEEAYSFHRWQVGKLVGAGVDFLGAATLPALSEAMGLAQAMADTGLPYMLSFVLLENGTLLDGTPLHQAIAQIDAAVNPKPIGYMINCVHPANLTIALRHETAQTPEIIERILGLQGNTSRKRPEELDGAEELDVEKPEVFAEEMIKLHKEFGLKILGGCCGTDERHIRLVSIIAFTR